MSRSQMFCLMCVLLAAGGATSRLRADMMDLQQVTNDTGATQYQFSYVFSGNLTSDTFDGITNPWYYTDSATSSLTYNSGNNTTTLSYIDNVGGTGIAAGATAGVGYSFNGNGDAFQGTDALNLVGAYWGTNPTMDQIPASTTAINATGGGPGQDYLILYTSIQQGVSDVIGQISEFAVNVGAAIQAILENGSSNNIVPNDNGPMFSFNVGFQFSNTQIPLDDLNYGNYPPSSFNPVPGVSDGTPIAPGGYATSDIFTPEPSSLVLLGLGAVALAAVARRTRRRAV